MGMKRIDAYIREDQYNEITSGKITLSEHLRRALDQYLENLKGKPAVSQSKAVSKNG